MEIIPAIDIIGGKCVRLTRGDYDQQTIYNEDPLEVALQFEEAGLRRLHLVDLDGAKAGEVKNWKVLERIAGKTRLIIDFSGGISTEKNLNTAFRSGAAYVAAGSMAVKNETVFSNWILNYGADKFIVGADVRDEFIAIRGWTEITTISVFDLIKKYVARGVKQFFCTDIQKDGVLEGPATGLYKKILYGCPGINLIASGGIATLAQLEELKEAGCKAAIIGKAIYENRISLKDLKRFTG